MLYVGIILDILNIQWFKFLYRSIKKDGRIHIRVEVTERKRKELFTSYIRGKSKSALRKDKGSKEPPFLQDISIIYHDAALICHAKATMSMT